MFVHEYSRKEFSTYEECREDLIEHIDSDDIVDHFDIPMTEVVLKFLNRKNNNDFLSWLDREIESAYEATLEELITEYPEEDEGDLEG